MSHNQHNRYEPRYEDSRTNAYRGNPYGPQQYQRDAGDPRVSLQREQPYRQTDNRTSPVRQLYERALDPRTNPHSDEFDPRFNPLSPLPEYHSYPQPQYEPQPRYQSYHDCRYEYRRRQPKQGEKYTEEFTTSFSATTKPERYEEKKFDYRYDDRYYRNPEERTRQVFQQRPPDQQTFQPEYAPKTYRSSNSDDPNIGYDGMPPAGRANNYNIRITDLLTSIREPRTKDDSVVKTMEANKGYLVMMRFRPQDLSEVITAVQESVGTLSSHHGYVIGFAEPRDMRILVPSHQMMANDQWWDSRDNRLSRHAVACFWFKDIFQARTWFEKERRMKQPDFPNSNPYQVVAVPLTYGRNKEPMPFGPEHDNITLLWSEYPVIYERYQNDFLGNFSEPERRIMKYYGANPNVSVCRYKAGWPPEANKFGTPGYARYEVPNERVGRSWRPSWVLPETFITVSTFPSMQRVEDFFRDKDFLEIKSQLSRYSDPVILAITLKRVQGTSR